MSNRFPTKGFHYHVNQRQLKVFSSLTPAQRLRWLEEHREFTWQLASPATKRSWERLRGKKFYCPE